MKNTETRTLDEYTQAKLGLKAKEFARTCNCPLRTLQYRWTSIRGREWIENMAFRMFCESYVYARPYLDRFKDL